MKKVIPAILIILTLNYTKKTFAQEGKIKDFVNLSIHEQIWVISHPFVAKKSWEITHHAKYVADSIKNDSILDGNENGGQVDAFRHAFWMAMLSQKIKDKKAKKLGIAHEKKNKSDYKKNRYEHGSLPDAISIKMDLLNNQIGINVGIKNPEIVIEDLQQIIIDKIRAGELWIVKTDPKGNYLDSFNNVLQKSDYEGLWENAKCLVKSDYSTTKTN